MSNYIGHNRPAATGGPQGVQRSYASSLRERGALFNSYEHLQGLPRSDAALNMLRKVASQVKPIMRKRGWKVQILSEFLPPEPNLLGLNINRGYKILIRLRYDNNPDLFLPFEQVVDTMLHELSHNVWGEHDSRFHALWDELRDEHEALVRKGYTGEGFLSEGHTLSDGRGIVPSPHEMRRLARASAEKRKAQGSLRQGSGQRLGGKPLHLYSDVRQVITESVTRRNTINKGCASGRKDADKLSELGHDTFKTKAEEDDANNRAIAQALYELMEQEEEKRLDGTFEESPTDGGLAWHPDYGLYDSTNQLPTQRDALSPLSEDEQYKLAIEASLDDRSRPTTYNSLPDVSPLTPASARSAPSKQDTSRLKRPPSAGFSPVKKDTERNGRPDFNIPTASSSIPSTSTSCPPEPSPVIDISEPFNPDEWTCEICTCINPTQYLACDACGTERSRGIRRQDQSALPTDQQRSRPTQSLGWNCQRCASFMEHRWWTCSACGQMKATS